MNSTMVQGFLNLGCYTHEIMIPRRGDVHRGDDFGLRQLPDMKLVQTKDALDLENRFTDFAEGNVWRNALE